MKAFAVILICFALLTLPCLAQTTDPIPKFFATGIGYSQASSPQFQGWGAFGLPVSATVISYTDYDISALPGQDLTIKAILSPRLQYTIRTGFAVHAYDLSPKVSLWGLGNVGVNTTGAVTGASFAGGGFLDFKFGTTGAWGAMLILQVDKSNITGAQFTPRLGIRYRMK